MTILSALANWYTKKLIRRAENAVSEQEKTFRYLMSKLSQTAFGRDHGIHANTGYQEFCEKVPVRDYEGLKLYFDRIANGESDVCWPGKPEYLAKTSGTTSGAKYIPITKESVPNHINSARNAMIEYMAQTGNSKFIFGKLIFLSGSPTLSEKSGIKTGRLSGIVNHHVPGYLRRNQMPSWETNCIDDWETKVKTIAQETIVENMTLISGIPPWIQMYFDVLHEMLGGKRIKEIFPNLQLLIYGGVNFSPYEKKLMDSIGGEIDTIELYPASEGFIAYQNDQNDRSMKLLTSEGIFYEFIKLEDYHSENPKRYSLKDVEAEVNYAIILNSNAGLWGYSIGDTVKFTSVNPYKLVVTGRVKHFISAFGEHVIGEEVEFALMSYAKEGGIGITEFTVAPQVNPAEGEGIPYHEWFVEFENEPENLSDFANEVDRRLQNKNIYYKDLITGKVLQPLIIRSLPKGSFINYMKSQGKLGGQNKVPRLSNDRKIADWFSTIQ
ncbi:MAG: hypothetical protein GC181_04730 [Bacteroidetes bacterium]|nr:hypothetical protein [Bacteroidota bacterium]